MAVDSGTSLAIVAMKRWKPHSYKIFCVDGSERPAAIPQRGQKWRVVSRVIDALDWFRIEGFNTDGELLGVYDNPDSDVDEVEELVGANDKTSAQVANLLKLMLQAQDTVLSRQEKGMKQVLDAMMALLTAVTARQVTLENQYTSNLKMLQRLSSEVAGEEDAEEDSMSGEVLKALGPAIIDKLAKATGVKGTPPVVKS